MTARDIALRRLAGQRIAPTPFETPGEAVAWLGAVQAQDYYGALWAIGLRTKGATEGDVEQALADRLIVRTWPMRGTLHIVAAEDIRWLLALTAPRVIATSALRYRQLELDAATLARSCEVLAGALQGGRQLTRRELAAALEGAGISTAGQRLSHILQRAQTERLVCYGVRRGKQFTFTLLDEWVPRSRMLERDEALAELAGRYFASHGPATVQDFVWWSGLLAADARAGLDLARGRLERAVVDGKTYWFAETRFSETMPPIPDGPSPARLLPAFDEYLVGYRDRSAVLEPEHAMRANNGGGILSPTLVVDGRVVAVWKRAFKKGGVVVEVDPFAPLREEERVGLEAAAEEYGRFLGLPMVVGS